MLSCSCAHEYDYYYRYPPNDFVKFEGRRRKRCLSCSQLIDKGGDCLQFECYRDPRYDIEESIYGDEVPIADRFLCDKCGEIFLNLSDLKFCVELGDMREALEEYWDLTGFEPKKGGGRP